MKIMDLNVNSFMGVKTRNVDGMLGRMKGAYKDRIRELDFQIKNKNSINEIISKIESETPEIVIFQEYSRNFGKQKHIKQ